MVTDLESKIRKMRSDCDEKIQKLTADNTETKAKLDDSTAVNMKLELAIEELTSDLNVARERDSQFFQKTPPIFEDNEDLGVSFEVSSNSVKRISNIYNYLS